MLMMLLSFDLNLLYKLFQLVHFCIRLWFK